MNPGPGTTASRPRPAWGTPWVALALALVPAIVGIWSGRWFVTQDGPAHLYNAGIIAAALGAESPYRATYTVRADPLPNWAGHGLYLVVGAVLNPASAERAAATLTLAAVAASVVWLRRRVVGEASASSAILAVLLGLNVAWLLGFTGFLLGAALFPVTLGIWWDARDRMTPARLAGLWSLIVVGYFCHPVSLGLTAFGIVVLAMVPSETAPGARRAWSLAVLAPLVPLAWIYLGLTRAGGPFRPEWGYLAAPFSPRSWLAQLGWVDPISLAAKVYRPFGATASALYGLASPAAWTAAGLTLLIVATLRDRDRRRSGWGVLALALGLAGVFGPDTVGASHGHYLPQRVALLGMMALVPWLRLDLDGWPSRAGRAALVVALGLQSAFVWDYARESRRTAGTLATAVESGAIGRGRRVAAVLLDIRGRFRANPLLHADCLLGVGTGSIIWGDYETTHYYFPVQLRNPDGSPRAADLEAIAMIDGDPARRARRWSDLLDRHAGSIDTVVVWGLDRAIDEATSRRYRRAWRSADGRVGVWTRDDPG